MKNIVSSLYRKVFLTAFVFCILLLTSVSNHAFAAYFDYSDVLLVINDSSPESVYIGNYFKAQRNIPTANVVHITTPPTETMSRSAFTADIKSPLETYIISNGLTNTINYIVLTKGIPLQIGATGGSDNASPDSELTLILSSSSPLIGGPSSVANPYYQANTPFSHSVYGIYLVTRLDGYSTSTVKALIDRSANATTTNSGKFVLDVDPTRDGSGYQSQNDQMRAASPILTGKGYTTVLDQTNTYLTGQTGVLGYWSWGSNDSHAPAKAIPGNTYVNGAIGDTAVSTSGRTLTYPPSYGQSLIADLIEEGISGVQGYSSEPYTGALSHPDLLFDRYTTGYNFADSMYMSTTGNLSWQNIVVGDPKMIIVKTTLTPNLVSPLPDAGVYMQNTTFSWISSVSYVGISKYQLYIDGSLAVDNITSTTTSVSTTTPTALGFHTWYIRATDASSTVVQSPVRNFTVSTAVVLSSNAIDTIGHLDYSTSSTFNNPVVSYTRNGPNDVPSVLGVSPGGSALDSVHHRFFLSDISSNRVLVFTLNSDNSFPDRAPDYVLGQSNFGTSSFGLSQSKMRQPKGLAYDPALDRLFVVDNGNSRVLIFNTSSITNGMNASYVLGEDDFITNAFEATQNHIFYPTDITYDSTRGRLFVTDQQANRIVVFNATTTTNGMNASYVIGQSDFTSAIATTTQSGLNNPNGIAFDSVANRLFVNDLNNRRTLIFNTSSITNGMNASYVLGQTDFVSAAIFATSTQSSLLGPSGAAFSTSTNRLFISSSIGNRVVVFNMSTTTNGMNASYVLGQSDFTSAIATTTQSGMYNPSSLSYDESTGKLFVSDQGLRVLVHNTMTITNGQNAVDVLGQSTGGSLTDPQPDFTKSDSGDGAKAFSLSSPRDQILDTVHHRLFIADSSNNRVLVFQLTSANRLVSHLADYVLGQPNLGGRIGRTTQSGMSSPVALAYDPVNNRLFVGESVNRRVLVYDTSTISNGMNASYVLGALDFVTAGSGIPTQSSFPIGVTNGLEYDSANNRLFVSDTAYRVLIFSVATITNGMNASYVLGQTDFTSSTSTTSQSGFTSARNMTYDAAHSTLYVVDGNRVVVYSIATTTNGMNASYVIGQTGFTQNISSVSQSGLSAPSGIEYDSVNSRLFVANANRVTAYDVSTLSNGLSATNVIGQTNFTGSTASVSQSGLNAPQRITYDALSGKLYVAESGAHRITVWPVGVPRIVVSKITASVTKNGSTDSITVALSSEPTASVTVTASSSDFSLAALSLLSLTFSSTTWNTPQTITITGGNTSIVGPKVSQTAFSVATSSSASEYANAGSVIVTVTTTDPSTTVVTQVTAPAPIVVTSGGGGSYFTPVTTALPTTNQSSSTSLVPSLVIIPVSSPVLVGVATKDLQYFVPLSKNLAPWSNSTDVKALQKQLNKLGFTVASRGQGSVGKETQVYGPSTKAAVKRFQEKYKKEILTPVGLKKGTGFLGTLTRKKLNSLVGGVY